MGRLLNFAVFYLGWFACVIGASRGQLWLGPLVVGVLVLNHLRLATAAKQEARLILLTGLFGFAVDTLQAWAGLYAFTRTSVTPWLCPPWMIALWMIFATTLNASMSWLAGRYRLSAVLGAICGPISYAAGARLGAIEFPAGESLSLVGIGVVWTLVMPSLLWLRELLATSTLRFPQRSAASVP